MKDYFVIREADSNKIVDIFNHEWLDFVIVEKWSEFKDYRTVKYRCTVESRLNIT